MTIGGKSVNFAWSFAIHIPVTLNVALFFKRAKHWVYCAGSKIYAKNLSYAGYNLVPVHGFVFQ